MRAFSKACCHAGGMICLMHDTASEFGQRDFHFFFKVFSASSKIFRDFKGSRIDILIGLAHQQPSSSIELFSMRLGLAFHQERIFNHALTVRPTYAITPAVLCNETISFQVPEPVPMIMVMDLERN